jgi:hypothetical protein
VNVVVRKQKKLTETEFESQKASFLDNADIKQIILCLNLLKDNEVILVTEETESSNDNKLFKKIPTICRELSIQTMTLPEILNKHYSININVN